MSYSEQDNFFATAYRTGTDHWTSTPFNHRAHELALYLPKGSFILDIGAGRGRLLYDLEKLGFRAIGLENNPELVEKGNEEIKTKKVDKNIRFLHGNALNMPLEDQSFDALVDMGLMHHIFPIDYKTYVSETARVLKQGGLFFLSVFSKDTMNYLSWNPSKDENSDFEKEGLRYHFFTDAELRSLFEKDFDVQHIDRDSPHGEQGAVFSVMLLKKK